MPSHFSSTRDFIAWNEAMARKYDSESYHLRSNLFIRWIERRRVRAVLRYLAAGPEDMVLEIGCGAGVVLEQIPAGRLLGLDLSAFILQKTKRRLAGRPAALLQADAECLPFPAGSFARLVCTEVIEHVMEPRKVVEEMARVAAPGAVLVITIPNEALIDRIKGIILKLGLGRRLLEGTAGPEEDEAAYDSPGSPNEWHLHHFDLALLREVTAGVLHLEAQQAVPFRLLPLRYVVCCRVVPEKAS